MNFYKSAALAIDHLEKHQGSVKGSLAAAGVGGSDSEAKRVLALVIETLKYKATLQALLTTVPILSLEKLTFPRKTPPRTPSSASLVLVLLHDLLFTTRGIQASNNWPPKASISRHQARLKAELVRLQLKSGVAKKEDLAKGAATGEGESCRYIRWNPNTDLHRSGDWSLHALESHLVTKGFKKVEGDDRTYPPQKGTWFMDKHLDDCLLVFPGDGKSNWWVGDPWYESGAIILQDKASCMPTKVLMEGWEESEGDCLDATAAPGNKTSYISALMGDTANLFAFEKSHPRFKTLEKMLATANCKNVKARRADFTESNPSDPEFSRVTRILLDPSCSGSGIVNRLDYLLDEEVNEPEAQASRLEKLAAFQLQIILHAFRFPSVQKIVYSTCSIHPEEDEQVVLKALNSKEGQRGNWTLAPRSQVLPNWERRGRPEEFGGDEELADSVIRCLPEDKTNGFFVACFVRGEKGRSAGGAEKKDLGKGKKRVREEEGVRPLEEDIIIGKVKDNGAPSTIENGEEENQTGLNDHEIAVKEKTEAQLERARRKKAAQKQKRRKVESSS